MTIKDELNRIARDLQGTLASGDDIRVLKTGLPAALTPDWLTSILQEFRLAGASFSLSEELDKSGLGADMLWLRPKQIVEDSCGAEPGKSVQSSGFLLIGACAIGSGDYYYLDLRQASGDPPVVRVLHDYAVEQPYPLDKIESVSSSLSEFFRDARLS